MAPFLGCARFLEFACSCSCSCVVCCLLSIVLLASCGGGWTVPCVRAACVRQGARGSLVSGRAGTGPAARPPPDLRCARLLHMLRGPRLSDDSH